MSEQINLPTLALLAGGAGTRMGKPKAWLDLHGQPILEYLLDHWHWPGPTLLVTAPGREHPPACEKFDREVVDATADQGPLRGMLTALQSTETDIVVIATCDMPLVESSQLEWLVDRLSKSTCAGVMLRAKRIEPFPCAMRRSAQPILESRLKASDLSVSALATLPDFVLLDAPDHWPASTWKNLNSPEDLHDM